MHEVRGALRGVSRALDEARSAVPEVQSKSVERLLSKINTEWLPSDVAWDRVGRSWD